MSQLTKSSPQVESEARGNSYNLAFISVTFLFFMWGFMTVMNDVLVPYMKTTFSLTYFQSMLVQTCFFGAYFVGSVVYYIVSVQSGDPINKIGYKNGIIAGLVVSALGCFIFYPAGIINSYGWYLVALFVLGLGFTLLQITANPYVAILGHPKTASSRLNLSQGFNSLGTTLAPLIAGTLIFTYFQGAAAIQIPYLILGFILIAFAVFFYFLKLPAFTNDQKIEKGLGVFRFPQLTYGMGAIFMYVGGEVAIGSLLILFLGLDHIGGLEEHAATGFLSLYWGGLMIGRFAGAIFLGNIAGKVKKMVYMILAALQAFGVIYYANYLNDGMAFTTILPLLGFIGLSFIFFIIGKSIPARTLSLFALVIVGLLLLTIFGTGKVAFWAIIGVGIFNSIMWSNIFTLAIDGLGKYTTQGSALLVMMILGGALLPPLQGLLADYLENVQLSFFVPLFAYVYIAFYGWKSGRLSINK